jgi:putative hemolysin
MEVPLIGICITLIFSAFFSGMEIAYISSNRLKIELDKSKGTINGRVLSLFYKHESHFIAMLLLGNNIALVFFGLYAAEVLEPIIQSWGINSSGLILLIQTVLSTALVLITAEFLPKTFVQMNPNGYLKYSSLPMVLIYFLMYSPTYLVLGMSTGILKLLKVDSSNAEKVFSKVDLEHYVQDINDRIRDEQDFGNEVQILQNALDFDTVKARDCMVPRTEIISVDVEDDIDKLMSKFIDTGKSKIVVYREHIDNIIGYVHSFEMFKSPQSIKQILLPITFVPEAIPGKELLETFTTKSATIAVVVDEYGGTAGVVTIEDVIEEIFGEIEDEHDQEDWLEEVISEDEYRFSARIDIDYLIEEYDLKITPGEEYETLGGLILHHLESIPEAGTKIDIDDLTFDIEKVSDNRIEVVRIIK